MNLNAKFKLFKSSYKFIQMKQRKKKTGPQRPQRNSEREITTEI